MGLWGLAKLVLLGLLIWWLYRTLGPLLGLGAPRRRRVRPDERGPVEVLDVMVQDPQCGTYLPRHEAIRARVHGREHFFCSARCLEDFKAAVPPAANRPRA